MNKVVPFLFFEKEIMRRICSRHLSIGREQHFRTPCSTCQLIFNPGTCTSSGVGFIDHPVMVIFRFICSSLQTLTNEKKKKNFSFSKKLPFMKSKDRSGSEDALSCDERK